MLDILCNFFDEIIKSFKDDKKIILNIKKNIIN